ncbi:MAG TPA: type II toxin-antitoxin system VapC family toxin [Mucilaginibacter sp.]|nr:type II toxin-antitoxin system VapC family toxin [Mucilaginibacter sp.]
MVIDTSLFIEFLRSKQKENTKLYNLTDSTPYYLSPVTLFELFMGATSAEKEKDVRTLTDGLNILPFDDTIALKAGHIYHELRKKNQLIEFRDIFIAATCLVNELPLATLNKKHFERIEGLTII